MDLARILRAVETFANIGQAFRRPPEPGSDVAARSDRLPPQDLAAGGRLFGQIEARLAGVLVSALKEAFDRDRAHLEIEREQIEQDRRRAEELLRLELLRQAGEREMVNIRSGTIVTLVVWITSVLFMMVQRGGFGATAFVLLGAGWALLLGALGASFLVWRHVADLLLRGTHERLEVAALERHPLAATIPWLIILGLACTAASLLAALAI